VAHVSKQTRIPTYRYHKASGQAVVVLGGKSDYLGKWESPESRAEYDRVVAEWLAQRRRRGDAALASAGAAPLLNPLTVNELLLGFFRHAEKHYRHADGRPTGELDNLRHTLRPLRELYGHTPAREFGPLALRVIRERMAAGGLCRTTINAGVNRIRRAFRWAVSVELIPAGVAQALQAVPGLHKGRCPAREAQMSNRWLSNSSTPPSLVLPAPVRAMVEL
jgi:hypothetical protein